MTAGRKGRTRRCGQAESTKRMKDALAQLTLAEIAIDAIDDATRNASVSSAVLAGIAAADAACCKVLGEVSKGESHREAADLLRRIKPGGDEAANDFERLIAMKSISQYGFDSVSGADAAAAARRARSLIQFAESLAER